MANTGYEAGLKELVDLSFQTFLRSLAWSFASLLTVSNGRLLVDLGIEVLIIAPGVDHHGHGQRMPEEQGLLFRLQAGKHFFQLAAARSSGTRRTRKNAKMATTTTT